MSADNITAVEALSELQTKLEKADPKLAAEVRSALDAGREVWELTAESAGKKKRPKRVVRPLQPEEALQTALGVLEAYFVEEPVITNNTVANLGKIRAVDVQNPPRSDLSDFIVLEAGPSTRLTQIDNGTAGFNTVEAKLIAEQKINFDRLRELLGLKDK